MRVAAFAGSLRVESWNKKLLRAAASLAPDGMTFLELDPGAVPFLNQDLEYDPPASVAAAKQTIRDADALLVVTPEYNHGLPGIVKNFLDWMTRPPDLDVLDGKPLGIMGASTGRFGTVRSQMQLRMMAIATGMRSINDPYVHVTQAQKAFDASGALSDEFVKRAVREHLENLAALVRSS